MKVLIFGTIFGYGGIQSHLRWLSKALAESGVEVLILTSKPIVEKDRFSLNIDGVNIRSIDSNTSSDSQKILRNIHKFKNIVQISRNFHPHIYLGVGTSWYLSILPLVLPNSVRSIFHEVMSGVSSRWRDSRWGVKWWFDEVVGQSPTVAGNFSQSFRWHKPVLALPAIPEPLELTATLPKPQVKKVAFGRAKAALFSRLAPHKQAFWLVRQWDFLKDCLSELHIYGSGSEEALIRNYIEARGIGDRVKCFGRYPEGQAYVDILSRYDVTLLPTIGAEGAPLVLLESMACGVPFVAYGVGGIPDYGVDNPNVIIVPPELDLTDGLRKNTIAKETQEIPKFIAGVRRMAQKLALGEIDRAQLQQFYLERYSYATLKKVWLSYLYDRES
ncbi:glycosyltransferase family 4 protein [Oscillatoriales cyanobacterium LEGE 11467]|uniref:Glycosyltransferase family 4 protein n=1 Tax=Zarconia navalis LEGE 11467 TaxID=1828826 RepID=A0A928VT88_9CYAN|nr:glycosyltransferase family 4 protein [Zarconia navalis]MBE9039852.1 glycosyltransferase family 4 protein [Zarconia navalis LEGE 11467]